MWKIIPGLESYAANEEGQIKALPKIRKGRLDCLKNHHNIAVRSKRKYKEHLIKQRLSKTGYYYVSLMYNGIIKSYRVHRLIYLTFKGNIPEDMVIDHIDGNKLNNHILNLRCVTVKENVNNPNTFYNGKRPVLQIDIITGKVLNRFKSIKDAEIFLTGINVKGKLVAHIGECCRGERRTSLGYMWQYEDVYKKCNTNIKQDYRKSIIQYNLNGDFIKEYPSIAEAAKANNFNSSCIQKCAANKINKYKNFIWKYKENI